MKYDLSKKPTIGAARTLDSLNRAMFTLLSEKAFEEIAVQELCEKAMLPRATFYNYFDDKYDLLDYGFSIIYEKTYIAHSQSGSTQEELSLFLDRCIDFFDAHGEIARSILKNNRLDQYLLNHFRFYLVTKMVAAVSACPSAKRYAAPGEMVAKLFSEAVWIVLEWKYLERRECSKEQAKAYLQMLVGGIILK